MADISIAVKPRMAGEGIPEPSGIFLLESATDELLLEDGIDSLLLEG